MNVRVSTSVASVLLCLLFAACSSSSDPANTAGASGSGAAGSSPGTAGSGPVSGETSLSGTLGALGAVQPTASSIMISNSGETILYLSSDTITCDMLQTSRWLGSLKAGSQVVEIVIKGDPKVGTIEGEVNYAPGGKSSSYEVGAKSDAITFTKAEPGAVVEGSVSATYDDGSSLEGTFHAEFCKGGQEY